MAHLTAEKEQSSAESDEDILAGVARRKFEDYGGLAEPLRRYAKVFNLDGQNWQDPDQTYREQDRLARSHGFLLTLLAVLHIAERVYEARKN